MFYGSIEKLAVNCETWIPNKMKLKLKLDACRQPSNRINAKSSVLSQ